MQTMPTITYDVSNDKGSHNMVSLCTHTHTQAFVNAPSVVIPPIHLGIVVYLIYLELGSTAFLTVAFIVVYVLLQIILGRLHLYWRYVLICMNLVYRYYVLWT